jgi:hypothetical protein
MWLWDKFKSWFNIGGVTVLLWKYTEPLSKSVPLMKGAVLLKTKSPQRVKSLEVRVVEEYTWQKEVNGEKRNQTDTIVMGAMKFPEFDAGIGYPLDLKPDENMEQTFEFTVILTDRLQNAGGVIGSIAKAANWLSSEKLEYYIIAEAAVDGAMFATQDKKKIEIVP